jgi:glycosyltransferase involved in cell wall biosynthesis
VRVLLLSAVGTRINPYLGLLRAGLDAAGAEVEQAERLQPPHLAPERRPDILHLHWLDHYDVPPRMRLSALEHHDIPTRVLRRMTEWAANTLPVYQWRRWLRLRRLIAQLATFQALGGRVVYTVHNLGAHEGDGPADRWGSTRLIGLADALHVHDASTAVELTTLYGEQRRVTVIPHGHYVDSYPNTLSRAEARTRLDIPPEAFVYLSLGLLRSYKGLEELLPAFQALDWPDARLLLAGKPAVAGYAETLARLAGGDARVRICPRFVPVEEVQLFMNAADVCVLPYRHTTTSGAALLALSFGVPVVAPALGAFPALVQGRRGVLYDARDPDGLTKALGQARATDRQDVREELIDWVRQYDWAAIGRQFLDLYRALRLAPAGAHARPVPH